MKSDRPVFWTTLSIVIRPVSAPVWVGRAGAPRGRVGACRSPGCAVPLPSYTWLPYALVASVELVGVAEDGVVALHGLSLEAATAVALTDRCSDPTDPVPRNRSREVTRLGRRRPLLGSPDAIRTQRPAVHRPGRGGGPRGPGAEASGWDGFFLWDHLSWDGVVDAHDPWVLLGAIAQETERMRLGTMVTPLSRRRPQVVAKHLTTLDHLSGGRAILGRRPGRPARPRLLRLR